MNKEVSAKAIKITSRDRPSSNIQNTIHKAATNVINIRT